MFNKDANFGDGYIYFFCSKESVIDKYGVEHNRYNKQFKNFFDYYDKQIKHTFISKNTKPFMILDREGVFGNIQNFTPSNTQLDLMQSKGLDVYTWEIPIMTTGKDIGIDFSVESDTIYDLNSCNDYLHGFQDKKVRIPEIEILENFASKYSIPITVCTGLYNLDKHIQTTLQLKTQDLYVSAFCLPDKELKVSTYIPEQQPPTADTIQSKFICMNKRYEAIRQVVAAFMLDKDARVSYIHKHTDYDIVINDKTMPLVKYKDYWQDINNRLWFDINELYPLYPTLKKNVKKLEKVKRLKVDDPKAYKWLQIHNDEHVDIPEEYYKSFCAVVNESLYAYPFGQFADKTLNAIKTFRPFVLVSTPYTLEYMKKLGFKTFDNYWSEDYDKIENHVDRLKEIFNVVEYINSLSLDMCKEIYQDMQVILDYNHKLLYHIRNQKGI